MVPARSSHPSPDRAHVLALEERGEIRWGPSWYAAALDGRALGDLDFGGECAWSADSTYVALQRWHTTREADGPDTALFVVRLADLACYDRPRCRGGWVTELGFEGSAARFARDTSSRDGQIEHSEIDLATVEEWRPIFPKRRRP